jgi:cytochrome c
MISKPSILMIFSSVTLAVMVMSASLIGAQGAQAGDPQKGQTLFKDKCSHCHSDQQGVNHRGPSLYGVVGRPAGQVPGYHYSSAMQNSGKTWDQATLSQFLSGPKELVPGTKMSIHPIKDEQDRADIIAYLATLHQ